MAAGERAPRLMPARDLVRGDLIVGPDASAVRIASRASSDGGRIRLWYTHPLSGSETPMRPTSDEDAYDAGHVFVVLRRKVPVEAVVLSALSRAPGPDGADGGLVVNVKDAPYLAQGDGVTDDTASLRAALADTPRYGTCYLPPGVYLVGDAELSILAPPTGVTVAGAGMALSVIRTSPDSAAKRVVNTSARTDVTVRDLGFDGASHPTTKSGVFASARDTQKNLRVLRCRFVDFMPGDSATTSAAVYTWTSDGVQVLDNEFVGCGRAITIDQPDGQVRVAANRISAPPDVMATGILIRRSSDLSSSEAVVDSNHVRGADRDISGVGAEGHGIAVYRVRDVHVTNNHTHDNRRGILISQGAFGTLVQGNTCVGNSDAGIRIEPEIAQKDTTVGTGGPRGVTVVGNTCRDNAAVGAPSGANSGIGITLSYAAGSSVVGNRCHDNTGDGIFCDSDRVSIIGNTSYNNFRGYPGPPTTGQRAGIRIYQGDGCTVVGNHCFDNGTEKTQDYGLSLSTPGRWHLVHGNDFSGNGVGAVHGTERIREGFYGSPPVNRPPNPGTAVGLDAAVINAVVKGLRDLGLFS